jgi:LysM repeat protein
MGKYIVKQGDTLSGIAKANGVTVDDLVKWNGISNPDLIGIGQEIKLSGDTIGSNAPAKPSSFTYEDFNYGNDHETAKPSAPIIAAKPDDFTYNNYTPSDSVTKAEAALNAQLANKPGEYKSQWQAQLDDAINKILNREKFSYDLNGDALYQQYKDKYIQQGKLAMGDAIGQASAMTGGYGNSYAQSVGQQAYNAQLQNLNDIVPELYQMALDKYNMEGQDLYNQYAMLGERENADYGRYRDSMADWQTERDYLQGRYDSERGFDYSKYTDDRNFKYGQHRDEVADWQNDRNFQYGQYRDAVTDWQTDRNFEYGKYADDKEYAYKNHENDIAYDKWLAEYNTAVDQYNENMKFNREQFDWQKDQANKSSGGGDNTPVNPNTPAAPATPAAIPDDIRIKASTFTNNDDLADWAYGMASAGAITEEQADQLITDNMDRNEKYTEQTDEQGNKTRVASYSQMMENFDAWERVTNGGVNLLGIDKDAVVRSPDGKTMTLLELKQKLIDEDMDATEAQNKIKALQQKLGISSNWLFGW